MSHYIQESLSTIYLPSTSHSTLESRIHHSQVSHPQDASHNLPLQTATLQRVCDCCGYPIDHSG